MTEPRAQRTLVKSPPELWAEVSDAASLARHLGEFGEIRITRLEPETIVAWEGDRASGTVELEVSGWGTKVTLTATPAGGQPAREVAVPVAPVVEHVPEPEPEPVAVAPEPEPEPVAAVPAPAPEPVVAKTGLFARLFGRKQQPRAVVEPPAPEPPAPEPEPVAIEPVAIEPDPEPVAIEPEPIEPEPEPIAIAPEPEPQPEADQLDADRTVAILTSVLDDLGSAHHRPFSRS